MEQCYLRQIHSKYKLSFSGACFQPDYFIGHPLRWLFQRQNKKVVGPAVKWNLIQNVIKARRKGLMHLLPAAEPARLDCLAERCAMCCKNLGGPVVTPDEAEKIGHQTIIKDKNVFFIKSQNGLCCLLKDGLCSIYSDRPTGCREYPWYNIGGQLHYDSGCPGIKHDGDEHPDINRIQPFENFFPRTPKFILRLIKSISHKK